MLSSKIEKVKNCSRNIPIKNVGTITFVITFICFFISVPILVAGYNPRVLTESKYQYVVANVIGYSQESVDCTYACNCRLVCSASRPNCKNSWEKHRVCDTCRTPCQNGWVIYSVLPPGPSYVFNAFYSVSRDPIPYLKNQHPLNSTIDGYYSSYPAATSENIIKSVVYGDEMTTSINCFIAGFVFVGIGCLTLLIFCVLLIMYYVSRRN